MIGRQTENETGYWLIEPAPLSLLMATPAYRGFAETFLRWIAREISEQLDLASKSIQLEVVEANYHGPYPCLGATGATSDPIVDEIEPAIQELLRTTTLETFLESFSSPPIATGS